MVSVVDSRPARGFILLQEIGQRELIAVVIGLLALAVVLVAPPVLRDPDTYWHVATGQWILAHGRVPDIDPFSFSHAGKPWTAHEWLAEVLMALAYGAGGWAGVVALYGLALVLTLAVLTYIAGRHLSGLSLAATVALAFACMSQVVMARPHLLAAPVLLLWIGELLAARDAGRAPRLWTASLMCVWANLHGSFVFGFVILAVMGLEALVASWRAPWPVVRGWGLFGVATLAASLLTPHGVEGILYPFEIVGMKTLSQINEWQPLTITGLDPLAISLLATLFVCMTRGVRVPPLRMAFLLLVFFMALEHGRQILVLALVAPVLLAQPLATALGAKPAEPGRGGRRVLAAGALAAAALIGLRLAAPVARADGLQTPAAALAHVPPALAARPVFNDYAFGGYLIFKGVRPFMDGRSDMYGDDLFGRYLKVVHGDGAAFDAVVRQYGIAWTMLTPRDAETLAMDARPGWRLLYRDKWAAVHVRADAAATKDAATSR